MHLEPAWLTDGLEHLQQRHLTRPRRLVEPLGNGRSRIDGRDLIDFSTNDYLGLARDSRLADAAAGAPAGAGASPLVSGRSPQYCQLERDVAAFENTPAALLFPSGFAANLGTVAALVTRDDVIFSDRDNHASLIDGCRLSGARVQIYQRARLDALADQLAQAASAPRRLIVTDGLFSMDGLLAPLDALCDLADTHDAMVLVDEAHATGTLGASGRGTSELLDVEERVTLRIGTLSKAVGAAGGFAVGTTAFIDHLWHHARPQVFSTALPPATCAAASAGLQLIIDAPQRRVHLAELGDSFRSHLSRLGLPVPPGPGPIIPVLLSEASAAVETSAALSKLGFFVPAIRPPTVPQGTARLRVSLSALHSQQDIDRLADAISSVIPMEARPRV